MASKLTLRCIKLHNIPVCRRILPRHRITCSVPHTTPVHCYSSVAGTRVIDIRSDVLTQPTAAMRAAMAEGTTRDDIFREDPSVRELEETTAKMFGMQAALFVPSGTMGNLIAVLSHCQRRGLEVLFGHMSHMIMYEQGGVAQLGGVMPRTIPNKSNGTFDLDLLDEYIRPSDDPHQPLTALIAVEDTHGNCGGKVLPLDFLAKLRKKTHALGLPVHMDGARLMNAVVSLNTEPHEILQHVDSVSVCLSKGVGAPIGSVIGGTQQLIEHALRLRKVLGGGWRKPGPLAAAGLVALQDYKQRLAKDHENAQILAKGIMANHQGLVDIDIDAIHSNIVMVKTNGFTAAQLADRLKTVSPKESSDLGQAVSILALPFYKNVLRLILCHNITQEDTELAVKKVTYVLAELAS